MKNEKKNVKMKTEKNHFDKISISEIFCPESYLLPQLSSRLKVIILPKRHMMGVHV
jgi:hypothetical protein